MSLKFPLHPYLSHQTATVTGDVHVPLMPGCDPDNSNDFSFHELSLRAALDVPVFAGVGFPPAQLRLSPGPLFPPAGA